MSVRRWFPESAARRIWPLAALAAFWSLTLCGIGLVPAQDDLKDAQAAENKAAATPVAVAPAQAAPAAMPAGSVPGAGSVAAPGAPAASGANPTTGQPESKLTFFYNALGIFYTVTFLGIPFFFVALVVMNFLALRREAICPHSLIESFEARLNDKQYQEAYELARKDESFLGRVLSAGLAKLSSGYPVAVEAMQGVGEDETMKLEQRLSYIALIGTISPMVGLLGTVDGMVEAFQVIANSNTQPKPSELAHGISKALITTLVGLWIAIPAVTLFGFFRNRMTRLVFEAGVISEQLMGRFAAPPVKKP